MKANGITKDDWLNALREADVPHENDQSALTYREYGAMMGVPHFTAARHLDKLEKMGKAVRTRKVGTGSDGRRMSLVAYRLKK